ncbi:MAG: TIR domain-containing protein [Alphaproteobacteria bacterium]|nr:TIR domain-containing protein [Alphaproteobacteria bacterium]
MADIFISYAREDRDWVERLAEVVEAAGMSVWWDSRQRYGKSFEAQIVEELGRARCVIVVWSRASLASDWVKDEAQEGRERGVLLPILKDGVLPPLGFKQLHSANLSDWTGGEHKALPGVLDALRELTGKAERTVAITARPKPVKPERSHAPRPAPATPAAKKTPGPRILGRLLSTMNANGAPPKPAADAARFEPVAVLRHDAAVHAAAVTADGAAAVTGAADGEARLWDAQSGAGLATLSGHTGAVTVARFAPDGGSLVTGGHDSDLRLWTRSGEATALLSGHEGPLRRVAFAPDGLRIASAADDDMPWLWDARSGAALTTLQGHDDTICDIAFAPDGMTLVTASRDATARLWSVKTGRPVLTLKGHIKGVLFARFAPGGGLIATGSANGSVRLWDPVSGTTRHRLGGHGDAVSAVAFGPDGKRLLTAARDGTAFLWDTASGAGVPLPREGSALVAAVMRPDGSFVAAYEDGWLRLYGSDGTARASLHAHAKPVQALAGTADGLTVVSGSEDGTAKLWRIAGA